MRVEIPLIFWHGNRDRIMSIDFYPHSNILVTSGAESETRMFVKLWSIERISMEGNIIENNINTASNTSNSNNITNINIDKNQKEGNNNFQSLTSSNTNKITIIPKFICELNGAHTSTVNICRFSPNGMYLATGGDDNTILIWVQKLRPVSFGSNEEKITWSNYKILRGHSGDIYDISWSPDSKYLVSASIDNYCIIWNVEKAKNVQRLANHENFVQGVSWDPKNKYILSQSNDKSVKFYANTNSKLEIKYIYLNQLKRFEVENKNNNNANNNINENDKNLLTYHYYFADEDQCTTFVRRSSFSPDGKICLLVSGILQNPENKDELSYVVWGVSRKDFSKPIFYIPTLDKASTCVRFCPIIFKKKEKDKNEKTPELLELNYTMIFAIGTIDSVFIYGTDSINPKFAITNIHLQSITDLSWKEDNMLAVSSSDGYISFVIFENGELGEPYKPEEIVWDEKLKNNYETYMNIDINKNVMNNLITAPVLIKPKKKNKNINSTKVKDSTKINEIQDNNICNKIEKDKNQINNEVQDVDMKDV